MNMNFSEMTHDQLRRCGADNVGIAMGIQIGHRDVTPLECSAHGFYFRIGQMYFDVVVNEDGSSALYASNADDSATVRIALFRADGSIVGG